MGAVQTARGSPRPRQLLVGLTEQSTEFVDGLCRWQICGVICEGRVVSDPQWQQFMEFAAKFVKTVDLDADEYNYKLAVAEKLRRTREIFLQHDNGWFEALRRDIASSNLMNQYFMMRLVDVGPDHTRRTLERGCFAVGRRRRMSVALTTSRPRSAHTIKSSSRLAALSGLLHSCLWVETPFVSHRIEPKPSRSSSSWLDGTDVELTRNRLAVMNSCWRRSTKLFGWPRTRHSTPGQVGRARTDVDRHERGPTDEWSPADSPAFRAWRGDKVEARQRS